MGNNEFKLEEKLMITDVKTVSFLLERENGSDVLALYFFYYKTAKLQKTNQVRATDSFCMVGLKWGETRFRKAKKILEGLNLVEQFKSAKADGKWYLRINYIKSNSSQNEVVRSEPNSSQKQVLRSGGQMLKTEDKDINAFTSPNGEGGVIKKQPSCPLLNGSPLKSKYPNGHQECWEYYSSVETRRDFKFVNREKQLKAIHNILKANYGFDSMDKSIPLMEKKYGRGNWDFTNMAAWLEKGAAHARN